MNAAILVLPVVLIRYGLMAALSRGALKRAAHFPPVKGVEVWGLRVYLVTNAFLIVSLLFFRVRTGSAWFWIGLVVYLVGCVLYAAATRDFSRPEVSGLNRRGLFEFSRNPMYVGYFLAFLGCGLLTGSWPYLLVLAVFQAAVHLLILSEERWCLQRFGGEYARYMRAVGRYWGGRGHPAHREWAAEVPPREAQRLPVNGGSQ